MLGARAKMSLSRAQNIFMPANINSIVIFTEVEVARVVEIYRVQAAKRRG